MSSKTLKPSDQHSDSASLEAAVQATVERDPSRMSGELKQAFLRCNSSEELMRVGFRLIAQYFESPYAAMQRDGASGSRQDVFQHDESGRTAWRKLTEGLLLHARYQNAGCARHFVASSIQHAFAGLAVPITTATDEPTGSVAVITPIDDPEQTRSLLTELQLFVSLLSTLADAYVSNVDAAGSMDGSRNAAAGISKAADYESLHEFAFAITNNLKSKLGCDQVYLGWVQSHHVRILSMSGFDELYPRSPGVKLVEQAMAECYDAAETICYQRDEKWSNANAGTGHRLHRQWHIAVGNCPVASVPLQVNDRVVAVISLQNPGDKPFRPDQLKKVADLVSPFVPGLRLLRRAGRSVASHVVESSLGTAKCLFERGHWYSKITATVALACLAWMLLGQQSYVVSVNCRVTPSQAWHVCAPFDGAIQHVFVTDGQQVKQGELLATMDTVMLETQREKLRGAVRLAELEMNQAAAAKQFSAAAQAEARLEIAASELKTVEYHLRQSQVRAPATGVVIAHDIRKRVGEVVPLGAHLLEVVPRDELAVQLRVPEQLASFLKPGLHGAFVSFARPEIEQICQIDHIDVAATAENGRNVFTADCRMVGEPADWLRSGMEGVARVDVGRYPVWWVWFHRLVNSCRLFWWKL